MHAVELNYKGEATGIVGAREDQEQVDWLLRYLPEIRMQGEEEGSWLWDAVLAGYIYAYDEALAGEKQDGEIFRAWARLYNDSLELRIGLQELSFGPATYLRTLQWFDTKNPLDPTSFTKGVKGLLLRFSTEEDHTFWFWGLYGNNDLAAATVYLSNPEALELGGRAQFSGEIGEGAVSLHQREVILINDKRVQEKRFGFDLKLDLKYNGIWLESMVINRDTSFPFISNERRGTLGIDYTLNLLEEGIVLTLERLWAEAKTSSSDYISIADSTALVAGVPWGLLDSLSLSLLKDQNQKTQWIQFDWKRTYDDVLWNLSLYQKYTDQAPTTYGLGLLVQYNH